MNRLIPLSAVPYSARNAESEARKRHASRSAAVAAAEYRILTAPGCHGEPFPPVEGWVLTQQAAEAISAVPTRMPGGTSHCRRTWDKF